MKHYLHPEACIRRAVSVALTTGVVVVLIESGTVLYVSANLEGETMRFTWPIPNDALHTGSSVAVVSGNRTLPFRVFAALLAGMIAVAANIALLSIASTAGIRTAQGGLFLLFTRIIHRVAPSRSFMDGWKIFAPPVSQAVFHIVTGLVMAIFYAVVLEPKLPGRPFFKGVAYGTAIWFLNAFLVLPLTDEGIAGSRHINTVGLIAFALAHMSFFLVLSVLYGFLCSGSRLWGR